MREIKILALADHENIIKLYHCYASETHLNLLLEYAEDSLCALKQRFTVFKEK
jgi:serine/threonine protein kinase